MDELIKELQKKYIEDLTGSLSFHKLLVFATSLICLLKLTQKTYGSIWIELLNSRLKDIFDTTNGVFSKTTVLYILMGVIVTVLSGLIHKYLKIKLFKFFASKRKFDGYIKKIAERQILRKTENQSMNFYLADDQKKEIESRKNNLSRINNFSEILFAFFVISIFASIFRMNYFDIISGAIFFSMFIYLQEKSFEYYVSRVVPILVMESLLRDKEFRFIDGFEEKI